MLYFLFLFQNPLAWRTWLDLSRFLVSALLFRYVFKVALVAIETTCGLPVEAIVSIYGYASSGPTRTETRRCSIKFTENKHCCFVCCIQLSFPDLFLQKLQSSLKLNTESNRHKPLVAWEELDKSFVCLAPSTYSLQRISWGVHPSVHTCRNTGDWLLDVSDRCSRICSPLQLEWQDLIRIPKLYHITPFYDWDARYPAAAELCWVPAALRLRLLMLLSIGGRVRWIQRSGYLITSLLFPSSAPWTGRNNIKESHNVSLTWHLTEVWSLPAPAASPGLWQPCWRSWSWWMHRSAREELWCFLFHQTCNHGNTQPHTYCVRWMTRVVDGFVTLSYWCMFIALISLVHLDNWPIQHQLKHLDFWALLMSGWVTTTQVGGWVGGCGFHHSIYLTVYYCLHYNMTSDILNCSFRTAAKSMWVLNDVQRVWQSISSSDEGLHWNRRHLFLKLNRLIVFAATDFNATTIKLQYQPLVYMTANCWTGRNGGSCSCCSEV